MLIIIIHGQMSSTALNLTHGQLIAPQYKMRDLIIIPELPLDKLCESKKPRVIVSNICIGVQETLC